VISFLTAVRIHRRTSGPAPDFIADLMDLAIVTQIPSCGKIKCRDPITLHERRDVRFM